MDSAFQILDNDQIDDFKQAIDFDPLYELNQKAQEDLPVDYFRFYNSVSSVYSSKIEGEDIDFDSFYKHRFLNVPYQPDYTKRADDLYEAYEFIYNHALNGDNIRKAHSILAKNLLPQSQRGAIRNNPMFVINEEDRIEYVACAPDMLHIEFKRFASDIEVLRNIDLDSLCIFYYAAMLHLCFVKIHPFQDGNGRTARLIEKWFLLERLGELATGIELEKNYYIHRKDYYNNIKRLGLEYEKLDYKKSLDFTLMTIKSLKE